MVPVQAPRVFSDSNYKIHSTPGQYFGSKPSRPHDHGMAEVLSLRWRGRLLKSQRVDEEYVEPWWPLYALAAFFLFLPAIVVAKQRLMLPAPSAPTPEDIAATAWCRDNQPSRLRAALVAWRAGICMWLSYVLVLHWLDRGSFFMMTTWTVLTLHITILYYALAVHVCLGWGGAMSAWACARLFEVCLTANTFTSLLFWGAITPMTLSSGDSARISWLFDFLSINEHVLPLALMLVELGVSTLVVHRRHVYASVGYLFAYGLWIWAVYLLVEPHGWPYSFLQLHPVMMPIVYIAVPLLMYAIFDAHVAASQSRCRPSNTNGTTLRPSNTMGQPCLHY